MHNYRFEINKGGAHQNMTEEPWTLNPDLNEERIVEIANFIAEVRGEVIDLHDDTLGDTRLSLGMRAYECCRSRIISEANSGTWPWLSILTPNGRFTFLIGETPVRFVRNDPEQLPSDKLIPSEETEIQMKLFADTNDHSDIRWFVVIDTFYKNVADNMYFVGYNDHGEIVSQWDIPLQPSSVALAPLEELHADVVAIEQAPIKIRKPKTTTIESNE